MLRRYVWVTPIAWAAACLFAPTAIAMSDDLAKFYDCLDKAASISDMGERGKANFACNAMLNGRFEAFNKETIATKGSAARNEELKITTERVTFLHKKTRNPYALRVVSVDKDSPLHPDVEPGFIILGSPRGKGQGHPFDDDWIDSPQRLIERLVKVKEYGTNEIVSLAIFTPKAGVDVAKASPDDYVAATIDKGGSLDFEGYKHVKSCMYVLRKDCN